MKKGIFLLPVLLIVSFTFGDNSWFPDFPMTLYWDIKIWTINLAWWTLKVYNSSNTELASFSIVTSWKYWSNNAAETHLLLNKFTWGLTFKVTYNSKTYVVDSIDDSNRWESCPSKDSITFVSGDCRYDIILKEEATSTWWWGWGWWGWGWGGWWWGWGGWSSSSNDTAKTNSGSTINTWTTDTPKVETKTEETKTEETKSEDTVKKNNTDHSRYEEWNQSEVLENWFSRELNNAFEFAHRNQITTMDDINKADMNWPLIRIAMAKMLSQYAINILKKTPDTTKTCKFDDVSEQLDADYNNWVTLACQLGIMWVWIKNFRPYDEVTRAEFGTALSRMLFWLADWTDKYYSTHLKQLKEKWIISNDNPDLKELRWYVMLMLMRSAM